MTKRESMANIADTTPATISNWKKTKPSLYKAIETVYNINADNSNIDKKIEDLEEQASSGYYVLLPEIAQLEVQNETSPFIDDALFERREKLFSLRNTIYGNEL